ncbi:MAG: methylmalonyl Co-A mutase-associated GTPase MeaB [Thermoflexales bacterium]|nr:methylmalonyl Co-A mutase-associated GTPase MeaB [Thermoflexales bacterium]MDW8351509.1 methylmalonyl Co-A mutase-associated GTPase MeaB [Anaerolineae bacterium]
MITARHEEMTASASKPSLSGRDLARLISSIENGDPDALRTLRAWYDYSGHAHIVGITGAPGSGKSTLVAALTRLARQRGQRVAVVSVDPSSPFTGGAILGDRIRMRELFEDEGVFIRSMANRGASGGIARATADVVVALDVAGYDLIFVETVGVGQAEVEVARVAETIIVVEAPGLGDDIQAIKAGILEIADILVVNKADHASTARTVGALQAALDLAAPSTASAGYHGAGAAVRPSDSTAEPARWQIPILKTIATEGVGIEAVLDAITRHRQYLAQGAGAQRRAQQLEHDVIRRLRDLLLQRALQQIEPMRYRAVIAACVARELHPQDAAQALLDAVLESGDHALVGHSYHSPTPLQ